MVAYSFAPMFRQSVAMGVKTQTVRATRSRHAKPGERVQLYTGMRTKYCRKLVDADPVCTDITDIEIVVTVGHPEFIASITLGGRELSDDEVEQFAIADGFTPGLLHTARWQMGDFWLYKHGQCRFRGVVIKWAKPEIAQP